MMPTIGTIIKHLKNKQLAKIQQASHYFPCIYICEVNIFTKSFLGAEDSLCGLDNEPFFTDPDAKIYPGDYNGNGYTDLFVKGYGSYKALYNYSPANSRFYRKFLDSDTSETGGLDAGDWLEDSSAIVYPGDYNGDGRTDLFVKGYGTYRGLYLANTDGDAFIKVFMGETGTQGGITAGPEFTDSTALVFPGDYNGDGKTDLFVKGYLTYRGLYLSGGDHSPL